MCETAFLFVIVCVNYCILRNDPRCTFNIRNGRGKFYDKVLFAQIEKPRLAEVCNDGKQIKARSHRDTVG